MLLGEEGEETGFGVLRGFGKLQGISEIMRKGDVVRKFLSRSACVLTTICLFGRRYLVDFCLNFLLGRGLISPSIRIGDVFGGVNVFLKDLTEVTLTFSGCLIMVGLLFFESASLPFRSVTQSSSKITGPKFGCKALV